MHLEQTFAGMKTPFLFRFYFDDFPAARSSASVCGVRLLYHEPTREYQLFPANAVRFFQGGHP